MSDLKCAEANRHCLEPCGCLPPGFSRLKYFYGKHLGVADFKDEQNYHVSKQRFHNQRLHGSGILCGLNVVVTDDDSPELRVVSGSALDQCGREIVVPYDQCIDVAAWLKANPTEEEPPELNDPCPGETDEEPNVVTLCVMLRYSECPTKPEAAPRDTCGCGDSGCEFGRVAEGFQLELMYRSEAQALLENSLFPSKTQINDVLSKTFDGNDLLRKLAEPITQGCPAGVEEAWIMLGCVEVYTRANEPGEVEDIFETSDYVPPVLLSTEVIQCLLSDMYSDLDTVAGAPRIIDVQWRKVSDASYQLVLLLDKEILAQSVDSDSSFQLRKMTLSGWDEPAANAVSTEFHTTDPVSGTNQVQGPALYVTIDDSNITSNDFLDVGDKYHLHYSANSAPIVDEELRQLRPRDFVWRFTLYENESGDLLMQTPPFS